MMTLDEMFQKATKTVPEERSLSTKKLIKAYEDVMKTESGQRVFAHIINSSGVFNPCDVSSEAFLGSRAVGIALMRMMEFSNPDLFKETMNFLFTEKIDQTRASNGQ